MSFVAISIDLCGSTQVKQRIVELAKGDLNLRRRMLNDYKRVLYDIERSFYVQIRDNGLLEFSRLSLIKSIGDELWYGYDLNGATPQERCSIVRELQRALLYMISSDRSLILADGDSNDCFAPSVRFDLPIKIYADIVEDYEEINRERYEHLKEFAASPAEDGCSAILEVDERHLEFCERLNLAVPSLNGRTSGMRTRADYIGLEIDRFFRLTERCYPRLLTIGQRLFDVLGGWLTPAALDFQHLDLKRLHLGVGPDPIDEASPVYAIRQAVAKSDMKGISDDYTVYHLFDRPGLGDHFDVPSPVIVSMMEATRAFLAEKGFFAISPAIRGAVL